MSKSPTCICTCMYMHMHTHMYIHGAHLPCADLVEQTLGRRLLPLIMLLAILLGLLDERDGVRGDACAHPGAMERDERKGPRAQCARREILHLPELELGLEDHVLLDSLSVRVRVEVKVRVRVEIKVRVRAEVKVRVRVEVKVRVRVEVKVRVRAEVKVRVRVEVIKVRVRAEVKVSVRP